MAILPDVTVVTIAGNCSCDHTESFLRIAHLRRRGVTIWRWAPCGTAEDEVRTNSGGFPRSGNAGKVNGRCAAGVYSLACRILVVKGVA